jgi:nucleoside-diphosphate-sugar epimerase
VPTDTSETTSVASSSRAASACADDPRERRSAPLAGVDVEVVRGDIMDATSTAAAVAGSGRVYHTAAGFLMWAKDPERDIIRPSVEGTRNVLEAAARAGVEKVVYTSSSGTIGHGDSPTGRWDETRPYPEPHTHYLRGKIAAEREAFAVAKRTGLALVSIHPGLILGPRFWKPSESVARPDFVTRARRSTSRAGSASSTSRTSRAARSPRWRRAGAASATSWRARTSP